MEMQRFKSIIVSSAVALALTAANLSAQQSPSRPGGTGGGGGGDASASNQSSQITLETRIATSAVAIATGINSMAEVQGRIATSVAYMAANGVSLSPSVATSLVAIATGTDGMKAMTANIATSNVAIATGMNALVQMLQFTDGLEGLITSGNTLLTNIATSAVTIGTGVNRMQAVHADIATSSNLVASRIVNVATSITAIATGINAMAAVHSAIATSVNFSAIQALRIATSDVAIATGINAMAAVHSAIATSVVKIAQAGASTDTELPAAATPANGTGTPSAPGIYGYNLVYRSDQGRWYYGEAASSSTGVTDGGTSRVIEASNSPVATAAVEIASRQAQIATGVTAISDRFPDRIIAGTLNAKIATSAPNYRQVIAAVSGQIIYVTSEIWTVTQGALITWGYGKGTNCDSNPVDLTGEMSIAASSGATRHGVGVIYEAPAGNALCVRIATASAGAAIGGQLRYVQR